MWIQNSLQPVTLWSMLEVSQEKTYWWSCFILFHNQPIICHTALNSSRTIAIAALWSIDGHFSIYNFSILYMMSPLLKHEFPSIKSGFRSLWGKVHSTMIAGNDNWTYTKVINNCFWNLKIKHSDWEGPTLFNNS